MLTWMQAMICHASVNRVGTHGFMDVGGCRVHVSDQMHIFIVTCLAEMHHIAGPAHTAFTAEPRLGIVGRLNPFVAQGSFLGRAQAHSTYLVELEIA